MNIYAMKYTFVSYALCLLAASAMIATVELLNPLDTLKKPVMLRIKTRIPIERCRLRGGSASVETSEPEVDQKKEHKNEHSDFIDESSEFQDAGSNRTEENMYKPKQSADGKSKRYDNLPDEETEMSWRFADMIFDRRGQGTKLRHTKSREVGKRSIAKSQTLKKLQHGTKRQQQGATMENVTQMANEIYSFGMMLLSGTTSGNILCEDLSDIYGRKWYNTTEGREFLERAERLEAYASINKSTFEDAWVKCLAPEDFAVETARRRALRREMEAVTGEAEPDTEESSSEDSVGDRLDWGYDVYPNGTFRAYGNLSFRKHARRRDPYIAQGLDFPEECYRRLE